MMCVIVLFQTFEETLLELEAANDGATSSPQAPPPPMQQSGSGGEGDGDGIQSNSDGNVDPEVSAALWFF